jgi:membrane peptidoglycan carboxypeptidase
MPDEKDYLPGDDDYTDDDVPFKLPKSENSGSFQSDNIHKEDTEDIEVPEEFREQPTTPYDPLEAETTREEPSDEDADLRASDPPLASGPPEDNTMVWRAGQAEDDQPISESFEIVPPDDTDAAQYTTDMDIPFRLPKNQGEDADAPISSRWATMPHDPSQHDDSNAANTLPGSGGLDPNPDFEAGRTMPNMTVQSPGRQQDDQQRYQRPENQGYAPPIQRDTPQPPNGQPRGGQQTNLPMGGRRKVTKKRRLSPGCMVVLVMLLTFCGGLTFITSVAGVFAYVRVGDLLNERLDAIDTYEALQSNNIYDRNGEQLFTVFSEEGMRINVNIEDLPDHVIDATLAIEDDSFYDNIGIDVGATTIALLQYLGASPDEQTPGGSTITQQLVRNVLFDPEYRAERSPQRKAEEIMLSIALTTRMDKSRILELYLNQIYYGNLAYGIEAATQVIFDKSATELTIGEAALLAGLPNIPAILDPLSDDPDIQERVEGRRLLVLEEMRTDEFITQAEYDRAVAEQMNFSGGGIELAAPHFTVHAIDELNTLLAQLGYTDEQIERGGLNVMTTVDLGINDMVQQAAADQIAQIGPQNNASNAAVVVTNPDSGEILAMVGSIDYYNEAIDGNVNVTTRPRQPGSTMKPFTYAAAIERGMSPGDIIWDVRVSIPQPGQNPYVPRNYDGAFHGPMTMRTALANSYNIPAVQAVRFVGVPYLLEVMERFGVESLGTDASRYGVSLTLGGGEITPLEMAQGYSVFANAGRLVEATAILCIWDNDNTIIYEYDGSCPDDTQATAGSVLRSSDGETVLDPRIAFVISNILSDNSARSIEMGSNSPLNTPGIESSAKTGTTNNVKDIWTVGYTRNVAIAVWVGNNDGAEMRNTFSGLQGAAPLWNRVMTTIYDTPLYLNEFASGGQLRSDDIRAPNGITFSRICDATRLTDPVTSCSATKDEWLLDSPAAEYEGNGQLYFPPAGSEPRDAPLTGSFIEEISPSVYQATVYRLNPGIANSIQFNLPGGVQPPPPIYCRVQQEVTATTPGAQQQLFIAPPADPSDAASAENYARERGLAFLPTIDCSPELLQGGGFTPGSVQLTSYVTSPSAGQVIPANTAIEITGTALFTNQQAQYYKIDLVGEQITNWTTIGPVHSTPVENGVLDTLPPLPPGEYRISLRIVGNDGNDAQPGFEVPFTVQ